MPANNYGTDTDNAAYELAYFYGGHGNDVIFGSAVANEFYGGQGNDLILGGERLFGADILGTGTSDNPWLYDGAVSETNTNNDYMEGGPGSDAIHGFDGDDEIYGGGGNDSGQVASFSGQFFSFDGRPNAGLYGGLGNDYVNGGTGNDDLFGDAGDDRLSGSDGSDLLIGGEGADTMLGGSSGDRFVFASMAEIVGDRIPDFDRKEGDKIDLSGIDAKPKPGIQDFKFIGDDKFTKAGQVSFKSSKVKINTDSDKQAEAVIFVNTNKMSDDDFLF